MWFVRTERPGAGSRGAKGRARATLERYSRKPRGVCAGRTTGPGGASWRACGVSSGGCSRSTTSRRPSRRSTRCDPSRAPSRRCKDASAVSALPITARGRQCEEGFFQWRGERKGAGHENRSKALTMDSGFVLADGERLATNLTTGNVWESKRRGERVRSATSVDSGVVVSSGFVARRRRVPFSHVIVNQSSIKINPRSPPSPRSSRLIRRAPPVRRPVPRRTGPRPPTRAGTRTPRHPP